MGGKLTLGSVRLNDRSIVSGCIPLGLVTVPIALPNFCVRGAWNFLRRMAAWVSYPRRRADEAAERQEMSVPSSQRRFSIEYRVAMDESAQCLARVLRLRGAAREGQSANE